MTIYEPETNIMLYFSYTLILKNRNIWMLQLVMGHIWMSMVPATYSWVPPAVQRVPRWRHSHDTEAASWTVTCFLRQPTILIVKSNYKQKNRDLSLVYYLVNVSPVSQSEMNAIEQTTWGENKTKQNRETLSMVLITVWVSASILWENSVFPDEYITCQVC